MANCVVCNTWLMVPSWTYCQAHGTTRLYGKRKTARQVYRLDRQALAVDYLAGMHMKDLCKKYRATTHTIYAILGRAGIHRKYITTRTTKEKAPPAYPRGKWPRKRPMVHCKRCGKAFQRPVRSDRISCSDRCAKALRYWNI
jgi:hypothetical protein